MPQVEIRSYTEENYPRVKEILVQGNLFYEPMDCLERLNEKIKRDPESILVATKQDQVVGTVSIMEDGRMPFIFRLAVDLNSQKQGIGKLLMEKAEEILKSRGYSEINILVEENDHELQKYYQRQGYEIGTIYRWMTKELI